MRHCVSQILSTLIKLGGGGLELGTYIGCWRLFIHKINGGLSALSMVLSCFTDGRRADQPKSMPSCVIFGGEEFFRSRMTGHYLP